LARFLFDENLPAPVAKFLGDLEYDITAIGELGAPPVQSDDFTNVEWCVTNQAVLVTTDHGRKNRAILDALAEHQADVLFLYNGITPRQVLELFVIKLGQLDTDVDRDRASGRRYARTVRKGTRRFERRRL
jgi:predicted nuclease of predicted toxin-antitoxin system